MSSTKLIFNENPTDYSNWVIPGKVAMGSYPFPKTKFNHLDILIAKKFNVFVCLVENSEIKKYGDYRSYVQSKNPSSLFYFVQIKDCGIVPDNDLAMIVYKVYRFLKKKRKVYIHCYAGHGRSGVVACCLLQMYYNFESSFALSMIRSFHASRKMGSNHNCPQTPSQELQIKRYRKPLIYIVRISEKKNFESKIAKLPFYSKLVFQENTYIPFDINVKKYKLYLVILSQQKIIDLIEKERVDGVLYFDHIDLENFRNAPVKYIDLNKI